MNILGKFEADLFVMTNAREFKTNDEYAVPMTEVLVTDSRNEIELKYLPMEASVSIRGMEENAQGPTHSADPTVPDTYKLDTVGTGATAHGKITFAPGSVESSVEVSYFYAKTAEEANIDNRSSAIGEAVMVYKCHLAK